MISKCRYSPETPNLGQNRRFLEPRDRAIWHMTFKNNRAPFLFYVKLYHFVAINELKLELQSGNSQFGSKSTIYLSRVTLKIDGWPWITIGHLSNATSSVVHHIVAIGDFKMEIQSGNAQFGSKSTISRTVWPCNLTYDLEKQQGTSSILL